MLSEVAVSEAFQIHESDLGASNLDIRKCVNDVRYQACKTKAKSQMLKAKSKTTSDCTPASMYKSNYNDHMAGQAMQT